VVRHVHHLVGVAGALCVVAAFVIGDGWVDALGQYPTDELQAVLACVVHRLMSPLPAGSSATGLRCRRCPHR